MLGFHLKNASVEVFEYNMLSVKLAALLAEYSESGITRIENRTSYRFKFISSFVYIGS